MKRLIVLALCVLLLGIAPAPKQVCTYENAPARFREVIIDPAGAPYGEIAAWSCTGAQSAIDEFQSRKVEMQAQAAAYRAAHPMK